MIYNFELNELVLACDADKRYVKDFEFNFVAAANGRVAHKFEFQWNAIHKLQRVGEKGKVEGEILFFSTIIVFEMSSFSI